MKEKVVFMIDRMTPTNRERLLERFIQQGSEGINNMIKLTSAKAYQKKLRTSMRSG